jgi:hypothetical protein
MVDCSPDQGRSDFETADVAALRRGFQMSEITEPGRKMPFLDGHYLVDRLAYSSIQRDDF